MSTTRRAATPSAPAAAEPDAPPGLGPQRIETYRRDGVVHVPGAFDAEWLELLGRGIERNLAAPGPLFADHRDEGDRGSGRYCEDTWMWSRIPEFERFVRESPAGRLAGAALGARRINLVMDVWFLREAGATAGAPWHHDISYFDFDGPMAVLWVPLEAVDRESAIGFVRGSHLWKRLFMRTFFTGHRSAGAPGWVNGEHYELPPDVEAEVDPEDVLRFELERGDCLLFDIRTLHGAPRAGPARRTVRRFTLRMAAEGARLRYRGDWAAGERALIEAAGHREGDALDSEFFPRLWEA